MDILVEKESVTEYNASVAAVNTKYVNGNNKILIDLGSLPLADLLEVSNNLNYKVWDLLYTAQAMYFVIYNWNKSFVNSSFIYPEEKDYEIVESSNVLETKKESEKVNNKLLFTESNNLLKSVNTSFRSMYKKPDIVSNSTTELSNEVYSNYDKIIESVANIEFIIDILNKALISIMVQYGWCRQDLENKFYTLMYLKSLTNPILDYVPIFPKIPKTNGDDFSDFLRKSGSNISILDTGNTYRYNFSGTLHVEKFTTSKYRQTYANFDVRGFYVVKNANANRAEISGVISGMNRIGFISNLLGMFQGYIDSSNTRRIQITRLDSYINYIMQSIGPNPIY